MTWVIAAGFGSAVAGLVALVAREQRPERRARLALEARNGAARAAAERKVGA